MFRPVSILPSPAPSAADRRELLTLQSDLAALAVRHRLEKLAAIVRKYDPGQPRAPAGQSNGGQWVHEASHDAAAQGARRENATQDARHDAASEGWLSIDSTRTPSGAIATQTFRAADGTIVRSDHVPPPGATWTERHSVTLPDGTIRVFENEGLRQTIYDGEGRRLSVSDWTPNGPEPVATVQQAFLVPLAPFAIEKTVVAAMALYIALSRDNGPTSAAVISFPARVYEMRLGDNEAIYVGKVTAQETQDICRKYTETQNLTNEAVDRMIGKRFRNAADYGTAVHHELKELVAQKGGPFLAAEKSFLKAKEEAGIFYDENANLYGKKGTIRVDVLDSSREQDLRTICVYDIKTGRRGLNPYRMFEIAGAVARKHGANMRIIVTEMRPQR